MDTLTIEATGATTLAGWLHVHNTLVPNAPLTMAQAHDRLTRHRLLVALVAGKVVGSTTVRPPDQVPGQVTVIARVIPAHQHKGIGTILSRRAVQQAMAFEPTTIMTCVVASSTRGIDFALQRGFFEAERYRLERDGVEFVDLVHNDPRRLLGDLMGIPE